MKQLVILFFLLYSFTAGAQTVAYDIQGTVKNAGNAKYAYLVSFNAPAVILVIPVKDNVFKFEGTADLGGEFLKYGTIFLNERGDITIDEINSKLKERVWSLNDAVFYSVVLEKIFLEIDSPDKLNDSKITDGGVLTKQAVENRTAIRNGKILEFVKKYPDSPMSLYAIQGIIRVFELPIEGGPESVFGSPKEMFALLSDRLKNSPQGLALKKKIDEINK